MQGHQQAPQAQAGGGAGKAGEGPLPDARAPRSATPPGPGPAPAPKEEDGDPQEGEVMEGPYPAGSGRGARRRLHQRPAGAGRPGRGGDSQAPLSGAKAARPAEHDPEGREAGFAEGRGQGRGGATAASGPPLLGRGEELPTAFLAGVVPYKLPVTPQKAAVANVLRK